MSQGIQQRKAYGLALLAVIFWSTIGSALKITLRYISIDGMLLWTVSIGIVVLMILNQFGKLPMRFKHLSTSDLISSSIMGFVNPFLYYLILFKAYQLLDAQEASILNYTWPIVLVLLSIPFLKQKIHWQAILSVFISFFGIIVISTHGHPWGLHFSNPLGVMLAVGSALFWAVYWILNMRDKREASAKILLNLIFGLLYLVIYFQLIGKWPSFPSWQGILGSAYIGIFEMSITYVVWLKALNYSQNTAQVSNLIYLSPFIGLFWIHLTVGEEIRFSTLIGLLFIVGGIVLQRITDRQSST